MSQVGRIGGHLLDPNLERQGIDLAFKNTNFDATPILYLDVTNNRIGVKTDSPQYDLDIQTDVSTTNAEATSQARLDNVLINAPATFSTITGPLNIVPSSDQGSIVWQRLQTDNLDISDNFIQGKSTDDSITLDTSGTGTINVHANTNMTGNLAATGDINLDGNVTLAGNVIVGDSSFSTVVINPDLTQDIVPQTDNTYSFGQDERDSSPRRFSELHTPDNLTNTDNVRPMGALISNQLSFRGETGDQVLVTPTITSTQSNEDTMLVSATGDYYVDGTKIETDNIHNTGNNAFSFGNTGIGYLRFMGDSAFKMPAGTDAQRPALPEIGDTRWNTDLQIMECFAGIVEAVTVTGTFSGLADAADILSGTTTTNSVYGSGFSCRMNLLAGSLTVVQFLSQGIGYQQGDQINIPGTRLPGGSSPTNDVTLIVGTQTSDGYAVATGGGAEISESLMEDLGDVYSLILG
jgi:hypothetical protein|tara:strand:- start:1187 stop:2578 length:1392 start_codon:yes stop_codon:yes gene_type:complete